jgi:hypothetical protein
MTKIVLTLGLLTMMINFIGCASSPSSQRLYLPDSTLGGQSYRNPPPTKIDPPSTASRNIDYAGIQRNLGLNIPADRLGFAEAFYNTCDVGHGYSSTQDCKREYMTVINFQLLCRDSEGTISRALSSSDMAPLSNRQIKWALKGKEGLVQTDFSGIGQIVSVSSISQKKERLKLAAGNDFLYMRAQEITRVVTPKPWCNSSSWTRAD